MKQHSGFAVLIAVLCATSVYAHGYGGMQGGGGGVSNPLTAALNFGGYDATDVGNVSAASGTFDAVTVTGTATITDGITSTATVTSFGKAIALKDVTSAPTVEAGYQGVYSLNTNGLQQLTVKGSTGAVTLATQGYYAAGGHFIVSKNADQTFSNVGETVTWTTETTDQPGGVDVSTYNTRVFTAPAAGVVTVMFKARAAVDTDPFVLIVKRFNSSGTEQTGVGDRDDAWFQGDGTNAFTVTCTVIRHMDAGDYLTLQVFTPLLGINLNDGGSNATRAAVAAGFFVPD